MGVGHLAVHADYSRALAAPADGRRIFQVRPYVRGRVDFVVLPLVALLVVLFHELPAFLGLRDSFRPDGADRRTVRRAYGQQ